jgi:hypothetical protein
MPAIQSPTTLLALLKRATATYHKKEPDPKSKAQLRQVEIVKGIRRLREMARQKARGPEGARLVKPFNARKKILLKKLTEHRKKLNSAAEKNADPNKTQLPAYLKALVKLTTALLRLQFANVTADEETNVNLDGLEEGDQAELDKLDQLDDAELAALEQEDSAELAEGEEEEAEEGEKTGPKVDAASLLKRFMALNAEYTAAVARKGPHVAALQAQHGKARGFIDARDFTQASEAIQGLEDLLARFKTEGPTQTAPPTPDGGPLAAWQAARNGVLGRLRGLAAEIAASKDPDAGPALVLLNAIIKNLPASPTTPQQIAELEKYLTKDDVIADACLAFDVRTPLLEALAGLKAQPQPA